MMREDTDPSTNRIPPSSLKRAILHVHAMQYRSEGRDRKYGKPVRFEKCEMHRRKSSHTGSVLKKQALSPAEGAAGSVLAGWPPSGAQ